MKFIFLIKAHLFYVLFIHNELMSQEVVDAVTNRWDDKLSFDYS